MTTTFQPDDVVVVRETLLTHPQIHVGPEKDGCDIGIRAGEIYTVLEAAHGSIRIDPRRPGSAEWFDPANTNTVQEDDMTTIFTIGEKITTEERFTALPIGTVLTDKDGWIHTKVADPYPGCHSTTYVDDNGGEGKFHFVWNYAPTITSFPTYVQEDDMTTNVRDLPINTPVRVTSILHGHGFEIGQVIYKSTNSAGNRFSAQPDDRGEGWYLEDNEVEIVVEEAPARPTIDFSTDSRQTAREYAGDLISRVNKPASNRVLQGVVNGEEEVDAYLLSEALLDAMRGVSTRFGQSTARRDAGRKAAYLGHIIHAVLASHADSLPAYEKGERSQKLRDLEAELASARGIAAEQAAKIDEQSRLLDEAQPLLQDARLNLDRLREERDAVLASYDAATEREKSAERANEAAQATLAYAIASLPEEDKQRVLGYWDGQRDARS